MSESWKNRFWSLLLVCTFAVVLSVCNKAIDSSSDGSKSSSCGIAYADFKPSDISAVMSVETFLTLMVLLHLVLVTHLIQHL